MPDTNPKPLDIDPAFEPLGLDEIMKLIPHRYPMLLVDRIVTLDPERGAIGLKNVTMNEPFFTGHFPARPVLPGVIVIECMAQTAACYVVKALSDAAAGKIVYLTSVESAKFRRPVVPGDQAMIHVGLLQARKNVYKFKGQVKVDGQLCAEAVFAAMVMDD